MSDSPDQRAIRESLKPGVLTCGDGRGFLVRTARDEPWIITAAHCLPHLPPQHPFAYLEERTYVDFVGSTDDATRSIAVECLFVDPISDVAVLAAPDSQALTDECEAFEQFVTDRPAFVIEMERHAAPIYALTLQNEWRPGSLSRPAFSHDKRVLMLKHDAIASGMSGSPLISEAGTVLSLVSLSTLIAGETVDSWQPCLAYCLPRWVFDAFREPSSDSRDAGEQLIEGSNP